MARRVTTFNFGCWAVAVNVCDDAFAESGGLIARACRDCAGAYMEFACLSGEIARYDGCLACFDTTSVLEAEKGTKNRFCCLI